MAVCGVMSNIANVAQLSGLHAVMLIALAARLLWIPQCKRECAKLEECARRLHALLQWPTTGGDTATQHPAVAAALVEAASLVDSYRGSTLWSRVRTAKSMEIKFRDMQDRIKCLCALLLCVHANLLTGQPAIHPLSDDNTTNHQLHGAETSSNIGRYISIGLGGEDDQSDNTEPGGFEIV